MVIATSLDRDAPPGTFEDLYGRHYAPLVRALTAACGDREVASDCVQEAFVRAHLRWRQVSSYDEPASWVRRVAINRMHDHFRHEARGERIRRVLAAGKIHHHPAPEPSLDILAALKTLPQQQRIAMSLFYVAELSVAEVAEAMRLSPGAVKFHLHQGRSRLRPVIDAGDHDG